MRFTSTFSIAACLLCLGCESDRTTVNDSDYIRTDTTSERDVIGRDSYEHGVPDRTATDRGVDSGGVARPGKDSQSSRGEVSTMDRTFIEEAAIGGLFEVRSAQLALERSDDPQIKQIASMILEDHQKANQELEAIARRKGIAAPQRLSQRYQEMFDQLQNAQGAQFGREFQDVQEKAHEDAIRLFERQAREGQDPDLKSFAERTLPVLRKHMDHVQHYNPPSASEFNPRAHRV